MTEFEIATLQLHMSEYIRRRRSRPRPVRLDWDRAAHDVHGVKAQRRALGQSVESAGQPYEGVNRRPARPRRERREGDGFADLNAPSIAQRRFGNYYTITELAESFSGKFSVAKYPALATEFLDSSASSISSMIIFAARCGSSFFVMGLPTTR